MRATPFHKILIANRGEIARRIIRSAKVLGYRTVAVYSNADANSIYLHEADQTVCIGEPLAYLSIEALMSAARLSGADSVHPGYGFLAENPDFAEACQQAGLVFIGPSAETIRRMGNKAAAKICMQQAGLPTIAGWQGRQQSDSHLLEQAQHLGFPLMIKAAAGGGGRGMRLVESAAQFAERLQSARAEAQNAFASSEMILERALSKVRHIEIQIVADRYGNAIHLGERDCSVQRRQQKLIEEAPSPAVNETLRQHMGALAVQAVKRMGYEGLGTLEFLLDNDGHFYFMEMNTRLQVEHPVTEAITGLDLVPLQLQIAAGEPLPISQQQVNFHGHAIEARLCAEDAGQDFMPQSGTLWRWQPSQHLRVEHSMKSGAHIAPYYDSMIAKLCAHGQTREAARRKLLGGLMDSVALGTVTNQGFLQRCLSHPQFACGAANTDFIDVHRQELLEQDSASALLPVIAAALLAAAAGSTPLAHQWPLPVRLGWQGKTLELPLQQQQHQLQVELDGQRHCLHVLPIDDQRAQVICDDLSETVVWQRDGACLWLHWRGRAWQLQEQSYLGLRKTAPIASDGKLRASMNGRVTALLAAVGDPLEAGQPILTLEAMKMEHIHRTPASARLLALYVAEGEQVAAQQILAELAENPEVHTA